MALLTRRALLRTLPPAAAASLIGLGGARKPRAQDAVAPEVAMRPLSAIVAVVPPASLPALALTTLDGKPASLAAYGGRIVVLNFWATWCVPCVAELPELDRLAAGSDIAVLAVSADRAGAAVVRPFAAAHGIAHATLLLDPHGDAGRALGVSGFPTTLVIDAAGRLRGRLEGPAAWSGAAATLRKLA